MKNYKQYIFAGLTLLSLSLTSCDDFLDTAPNDALTPSKTWKTESDVNKFLTGCYDFFQPAISLVYWDAGSDFGYNNFPWEGFTCIGNGTMTPSNPGARPDPAWRGGYMDLYDNYVEERQAASMLDHGALEGYVVIPDESDGAH